MADRSALIGRLAGRLAGIAQRILRSRVVRYGFVLAALVLGAWAVAGEWHGVHRALDRIGLLTAAGALVCVLIAMAGTMQSWRVLLAAMGSPLPTRVAARILFFGQLGKYLPGSIWPVLAQMELGSTYQVPRRRSASASLLSMVVSVLSAFLAALVTLPFVAGGKHTPYLWAFLAVPVLLACLYPKVLNYGLNRLFKLARRPPLEHPLTGRAILASISWSMVSWAAYGVQLWLFVIRLGSSAGTGLVLSIGTFAFAWGIGFLAVFAPAGAGVRDVLVVALLQPVIGTGAATGVAVLSRVLTVIGDLLAAAVVAATTRGSLGTSPPSPPDPARTGSVAGSPEPAADRR